MRVLVGWLGIGGKKGKQGRESYTVSFVLFLLVDYSYFRSLSPDAVPGIFIRLILFTFYFSVLLYFILSWPLTENTFQFGFMHKCYK